jgi:hypothetical protein
MVRSTRKNFYNQIQLNKLLSWVTLPFGSAKGEREGFAYVPQPNLQS